MPTVAVRIPESLVKRAQTSTGQRDVASAVRRALDMATRDYELNALYERNEGRMRFRLAPTYDMLPMMYAPVRDELPTREFMRPEPTAGTADQWRNAVPAARAFWETLGADARVSRRGRVTAVRNATLL